MRNARLLLLISLLLGFGCQSLALDLTPTGIYAATREACLAVPVSAFQHHAPVRDAVVMAGVRDGIILSAPRFREMIWAVRRQSLQNAIQMNFARSSFATHIAESPEFTRALEECYPRNPEYKRYFAAIVRRADLSSKSIAIGAIVGLAKSPAMLVRGLGWAANATQWSVITAKALNAFARSLKALDTTVTGLLGFSLIRGDSELIEPSSPREITVEEFTAATRSVLKQDLPANQTIQQLIDADLEEKATLETRLATEHDAKKRSSIRQSLEEIDTDLRDLRRAFEEPSR